MRYHLSLVNQSSRIEAGNTGIYMPMIDIDGIVPVV